MPMSLDNSNKTKRTSKKENPKRIWGFIDNVIRKGFEPLTHRLEICCSIQLSYRTIKKPPPKRRGQSGWQDSNLRPPAPKAGAIPGYATPRNKLGAVREGFEPSVQFPVRQFSKLLLSATQSPHQYFISSLKFVIMKLSLFALVRKSSQFIT